jgi:hypothetical protein
MKFKDLKPATTAQAVKLVLITLAALIFSLFVQERFVPAPAFVGCTAESHARLLVITKFVYLITTHLFAFSIAVVFCFSMLWFMSDTVAKWLAKHKAPDQTKENDESTTYRPYAGKTSWFVRLISSVRRGVCVIVDQVDEFPIVVLSSSLIALISWIFIGASVQELLCVSNSSSGQGQIMVADAIVCILVVVLFCFVVSKLPTRKFTLWFRRVLISPKSRFLTRIDMNADPVIFSQIVGQTVNEVLELNSYGFEKLMTALLNSSRSISVIQPDMCSVSGLVSRHLQVRFELYEANIAIAFKFKDTWRGDDKIEPSYVLGKTSYGDYRYDPSQNVSAKVLQATIRRDLPLLLAEAWEKTV